MEEYDAPFQITPYDHAPEVMDLVRYIKATECMKESFRGSHTEGKAILAVLLHVKHKSAKEMSSGKLNAYQLGNRGNNRNKLGETSYDRMFMWLDLLSPRGRVFAMLPKYSSLSASICEFLRNRAGLGVGTVCYIEEPERCTGVVGTEDLGMPIVNGMKIVIPLNVANVSTIPAIPLRRLEPNECRGFILHGESIQADGCAVVKACCKGSFCDRGMCPEQNVNIACGCFHKAVGQISHDMVLKMNVQVQTPVTFSEREVEVVMDYRSLRTSNLFIRDRATWEFLAVQDLRMMRRYQPKVRKAVADMINYVNQHGGWTIIGWTKKGRARDQSDQNSGSYLESMEDRLHISYMLPSSDGIGGCEDFKNLQLCTRSADLFVVRDLRAANGNAVRQQLPIDVDGNGFENDSADDANNRSGRSAVATAHDQETGTLANSTDQVFLKRPVGKAYSTRASLSRAKRQCESSGSEDEDE